jgi:hypothetical protein
MALDKFKHSEQMMFINGVYDDRGTLQHAVVWDQSTYTFYVLDNARGNCPSSFSPQTQSLDGLNIIGAYSLERGEGDITKLPARVQGAIIKSFPYIWSKYQTTLNQVETHRRESRTWEQMYHEAMARQNPVTASEGKSKVTGTKTGRSVAKPAMSNLYNDLERQLRTVQQVYGQDEIRLTEPFRWPHIEE